jgi:glutamate synthase domain-containing protein 3
MIDPVVDRPVPVLSVPEIRDYQRINAELVRLLDEEHRRVRLAGAERQRLLVSGLSGPWDAVVEVDGAVGPEFAADLDAPGLTIVGRGPAGDGAARGLRAGRVVILGDAGEALPYAQAGGTVVGARSAGPRAGLGQRGGVLAVLGAVGPLAAERQAGGQFFVFADRLGLHAGRGRRGGRLVRLSALEHGPEAADPDETRAFLALVLELAPWLDRADLRARPPGSA